MKKITWCGVAQSPYNNFLLNQIHDHFDLKVYYKIKNLGTHPWQLEPVRYRFGYMNDLFMEALQRARSSDILVMSGWSFWQHLIIMLIPMKNTRKIYWTDTPNLAKREWSGLKGAIRRLIVKIVFSVFDEVWSTGKPGCIALEKLGCPKDKIRSFPFFLDLSRYSKLTKTKLDQSASFREQYTMPETEIVFLCMGQVTPWKRFDDAVKALSLLRNKKAALWIAGTGPQEEELKLMTIEMGVVNQVHFLGWLQQDQVELAYMAADVFIHPASFDPFPTVVLDAMTWAKPIIGTDVSGSVADRVVPNKNGFIYKEGDVETLASHMRFFVENKQEVERYGSEARKTASSYPVDLAIKKFEAFV